MDTKKVAEKIAERLFRLIEREKRIIKGDFVEIVEQELRVAYPPQVEAISPDQTVFMWAALETHDPVDAVLEFAADHGILNA